MDKATKELIRTIYDVFDADDISTERLLVVVADEVSRQLKRPIDTGDVAEALAPEASDGKAKN